jgi:hypothetical protein
MIVGPAPPTLSKLINLKDFELFTKPPSETLVVPRAFCAVEYQRIYGWGPSVGLNNVVWEESEGAPVEEPKLTVDVIEQVAANNNAAAAAAAPFSPSISRWLDESKLDGKNTS